MQRTRERSRQVLVLVALVAPLELTSAALTELRCEPRDNPAYWIQWVHVDAVAKVVRVKVLNELAERTVDLLYVGPEQFGENTYHFNWRVQGIDPPMLQAFKLFRSTDGWRLINVGLEDHQGVLTLKALGPSQDMRCK
jgi:hypothetical protein